jgi:hypothetical protein
VEAVCHRVSIIHKGKLRVLGGVDELLAGELVEVVLSGVSPGVGETIRTIAKDGQIRIEGTRTSVTMRNTPEAISAVIDAARNGQANIIAIEPKRRTLEDLFVQVVGERIVVDAAGNATTEAVTTSSNGTNGAATYSAESAGDKPTQVLGAGTPKASANKYKDLARK